MGRRARRVGPALATFGERAGIEDAALGVELELAAVPSHVFRRVFASPPQFNWHRPYSCQKAVDRLGYAPLCSPEQMLRETVEHMLAHDLVGDCVEDPFDDRLVESASAPRARAGGAAPAKRGLRPAGERRVAHEPDRPQGQRTGAHNYSFAQF